MARTSTKPAQAKRPTPSGSEATASLETVLSTGRMWRMELGYSAAYTTNADAACDILGVHRRSLDRLAMAYYTDRKGRTYAWQVIFPTERWDEVLRRLS